MLSKLRKDSLWAKWVLILFVSGIFLAMSVYGTGTFADALRGYEILDQFSQNGKFNTLSYPSVSNATFQYFIAWWSPGQWMLPMIFKNVFQINSFQLIQFCLIFSSLIVSLRGYFLLFKKFDISLSIIRVALLCIATNHCFYWHTLLYYGGDLFMLAILPYFVIIVLSTQNKSFIYRVICFLLFCAVGIVLKNTFAVFILCGCSFLFFTGTAKTLVERIKSVLPLFITFIFIFILINYQSSFGETPATSYDYEGFSGTPNDIIGDMTYSIGSPLSIFSRFTSVIHKFAAFVPSITRYMNLCQLIPFTLMMVFIVRLWKNKKDTYSSFLLFFGVPFFLFFTVMFLQNKAISYEMRHFAPVAFIFFPALIAWLVRNSFRKVIISAIVFVCILDVGFFLMSSKKINNTHLIYNGLKLPSDDVRILREIETWDQNVSGGLIIIEDYWQLSIGKRKNGKIVLKNTKKDLKVMSGMELNNADYITEEDLFNGCSHSLLITNKQNKTGLKSRLLTEDFKLINSFGDFEIFQK